MSCPVQIIGSYLSPYVRKVLACLNLKGIFRNAAFSRYQVDPVRRPRAACSSTAFWRCPVSRSSSPSRH